MKILVTGGAGFIGSHLTEKLLSQGNEICVIDNLLTGNKENISHLVGSKNFTFIYDTILNEMVMKKLISKCDVIYHLAASVGVKFIIDNQVESIKINVCGTEILLKLASKYGKKTILASSSEVYGKDGARLLAENDDRITGSTNISRWSYSCTKALDEFLALAYYREKGLPVVIVRLFNTCGPRQVGDYGMVIPRFVKQALSNQPITVYGDGKQTRSFTYISDCIDGILSLANHPSAVGEAFNIGGSHSITVLELAEKIKSLTGSKSEIVLIPYEEAYGRGFEDMRYRVPDITKINRLTGYFPKLGINEMLEQIIKYHSQPVEKSPSPIFYR